jgi:hypothetical protein
MEKLCRVCLVIKETPYKDICRSCYQKEWIPNLPEKECLLCSKKYKLALEFCNSCTRKKRLKKDKKPCSGCDRKGLIIINRTLWYCTKCERQRKDKEVLGYRENRLKTNRYFQRKYRGHSLDDLYAPPKEKSKGWWKNAGGYITIYRKGHPNSNSNDCIQEHVYVMSEFLGRPLIKGESVHHKNGIRDDNRIENLELWHRAQPSGQRVVDKITWAKELLQSYGYIIDETKAIKT